MYIYIYICVFIFAGPCILAGAFGCGSRDLSLITSLLVVCSLLLLRLVFTFADLLSTFPLSLLLIGPQIPPNRHHVWRFFDFGRVSETI